MCTIQGVHCGAQLDIDSQGAPGDVLGSWESSTMGMSTQITKQNNWDGQSKGRLGLVWLVMNCDEGDLLFGNNFMIFYLMPQAAWDGTFREENDAQVKWHPPGQQSLENISWTEAPPEGTYTVYVELFRGPKAGMSHEKRWSRMDDHMAWGGSFISNWELVFEKIYQSKPRSDTGYKKPSIFGRHSDSRLRKKTYIKQSNTANTYFRIFTHVWSVSMTGVVSDLGPIGREHYATF